MTDVTRWVPSDVFLVQSALDSKVWTPGLPDVEIAMMIEHAGRLRAVKRWVETEWFSGEPVRWEHSDAVTWTALISAAMTPEDAQ